MKKLLCLLCCFVFFLFFESKSQNENMIWYFGNHAGLEFGPEQLMVLTNGALWCNDNSSTICDPYGNLLLYTNGDTVWNKNHQIMANGTYLNGSFTSGQCAVIVPQPGSTNYYIFTNGPFGSELGLNYSVADLSMNGGMGEVTIKNHLLFENTTEKLDAIYNPVDTSFWIVTHPFDSDCFYVYKLTSDGIIEIPIISQAAYYSGGNPWGYNAIGQMTISPDGSKIASGVLSDGFIELLDFDMGTGVVLNSRIIPDFPNAWGIAFSPNSMILYATRWWTDSVFRFNLSDTSLSAIIASKELVGLATASNSYNYQAGYMQLGPDGRIYIARYETHYLAVINSPDVFGPD